MTPLLCFYQTSFFGQQRAAEESNAERSLPHGKRWNRRTMTAEIWLWVSPVRVLEEGENVLLVSCGNRVRRCCARSGLGFTMNAYKVRRCWYFSFLYQFRVLTFFPLVSSTTKNGQSAHAIISQCSLFRGSYPSWILLRITARSRFPVMLPRSVWKLLTYLKNSVIFFIKNGSTASTEGSMKLRQTLVILNKAACTNEVI